MSKQKIEKEILSKFNDNVYSKEISNRAGKSIVKINTTEGLIFVKRFNFEDTVNKSEGPLIPISELFEHESNILNQLKGFNDQYVHHFEFENKGYLASKFIDGVSVHEFMEKNPDKVKDTFLKCMKKMDELHLFGFLHGDVQPAHFLVDEKQEVHLIDYGMAGKLPHGYEKYPGQLVYYASPEVCNFMMGKDKDFQYSRESELYSFASAMVFAITSELSTDFPGGFKMFSFEEKKNMIATHGANNYFNNLQNKIDKPINDVLKKYLSFSKTDRI